MRQWYLLPLCLLTGYLSAQTKNTIHRFDVIEIGGTIHLVRTPEGPYSSYHELPLPVRQRLEQEKNGLIDRSHSSAGAVHGSVNFVVSNSGDDGDADLEDNIYSPPTLRSAIENANKLGGAHTITFTSNIVTIEPLNQLPSITTEITIDGAVSGGHVQINGSFSSGTFGLSLSKPSVVRNITFQSWKSVGLALSAGAVNSVIRNNRFKFNMTGLNINADSVLVGGDSSNYGNIAVSNTQDGIALIFANNGTVSGNYCGTDDGNTAEGNDGSGVYILGTGNRVISNVLSGNNGAGLEIGEFSNRTLVWKNRIGVNAVGTSRLANSGDGITTFADNDSIIENVVSSNANGIIVLGQASKTYLGKNIIGVAATVDSLFGNRYDGIQVLGAQAMIENNIVSANKGSGITITGPGGAWVRRNKIGVNSAGTADRGNSGNGITILCNDNLIGGEYASDANVISGNDGSGIELFGGIIFSFPGPSGPNYVLRNRIVFNQIGTNISGTAKIPNKDGITLWGYIDSSEVYSNLVSGNTRFGIHLRPYDGVPTQNFISGNYIGSNTYGTGPLPNDSAGIAIDAGYRNIVGGSTAVYANLISGNKGSGILINGGDENRIERNTIGVTLSGVAPLPNDIAGISITGHSDGNIITSNLISGNTGEGIALTALSGSTPYDNVLIGNTIGVRNDRNTPLPNSGIGIYVYQSENTWIGGSTYDSANFISGNTGPGVQIEGDSSRFNSVWGNYIGTNSTGSSAVPNERGIVLYRTRLNTIGGSIPGSGNLISGNLGEGIYLYGSDSNSVSANIIGCTLDQTAALPNHYSGIVIDSSRGNVIGGGPAGIGNTVSGNTLSGIIIRNRSNGNQIIGNSIGTDASHTHHLGNIEDGIQIYGGSGGNNIGMPGAGNAIMHNGLAGIILADSAGNRISFNAFEGNGELGIDLLVDGSFGVTPNDALDTDSGANELQNFPELSFADGPSPVRVSGQLRGRPHAVHRIEFFESDAADTSAYGEGKRYLGATLVTTDSTGRALINASLLVTVPPGKFITSTATDTNGNTSEFSRSVTVINTGTYADLAVSIISANDTVRRGDTLLYTITVVNNGPDSATSVLVTDTLSSRLTHIADSTTKGTRMFSNGVLSVSIAALHSGEHASIHVIAAADSSGPAVLRAFATASQTDLNLFNNHAHDTAVVSTVLSAATGDGIPATFQLGHNFPNPFNPSTTITYQVPVMSFVSMKVFDLLGREVAVLVNEPRMAGTYEVRFDGARLSSGVYFCRMQAGPTVMTRKLVLQK